MLLTYLIASHSLLTYHQGSAQVEIPVHNRRASIILEMIEKGQLSRIEGLKADDARGCVIAPGTPSEVADVQQLVRLFDVARKRLSVKLDINSPQDKETYSVSAKIYNNDAWKSTFGESGLQLTIAPRINADGTVTTFLNMQEKGQPELSFVYRMKTGTTHTFIMSSDPKNPLSVDKQGTAPSLTSPAVTIQIEG